MLLQTDPSKLHLGWGVHIIEGPNKPLLAWLATAILVLSFAVSLSYDIGFKNKESGFAIGQWMVAVLATALTAVYFHLADIAWTSIGHKCLNQDHLFLSPSLKH